MRFTDIPKGKVFEISVDNPQEFSAEDIKRFLELSNCVCHNGEQWAEYIRVKRNIARSILCNEVDIEVQGNTLLVTAK